MVSMTHRERPVYTAHDIPDLFNALPTMFGFRPHESLVAVATNGPRRRMGFRMRLDMPAARHVDEAAQMVAGHLRRQGAEGAIVLAVTEHQGVAHDLLDAIEDRLGDIEPIVVARSDGRRYWVDVPGFPDEGVAYETSDHHLSIVQAVASGQQILPDREALVARFAAVTGERREHAQTVADRQRVRVLGVLGRHDEPTADVAMRELRPLLDRVVGGGRIDDDEAAALAIWVWTIGARDAFWEEITAENAEAALALLTRVAGVVVPPYEPAVLSLAAFAAWLTGDGAQALIAADRAVAADPEYSMAQLIVEIVESGLGPERFREDDHLRRTG